MDDWKSALVLLLLFWSAQVCASWVQWRHVQDTLTSARNAFSSGFLGIGKFRPRFGFGAMVLLVASPNLHVVEAKVLSGFSVFARFRELPEYRGMSLDDLRRRSIGNPKLAAAMNDAIRRIDEVRKVA